MNARYYENPVRRGFYPDPSVIRVGDDFYMVNSSFQYFPAIPISHSKDLVHWETIGHAVTNPDYLDLSAIKDSHGIWAPDIEYINGKFYIIATLRLNPTEKAEGQPMRRQLIVSSDRPEGEYSAPHWIDVDDIDPSLFVDTDGKAYMIIAAGAKAIELSPDLSHTVGELKTVWSGTGERCSEGPHIFYKDGYYYAMVAEGGTGYGHGINVARSKSLFGTYENSPYNPVMRQFDASSPIQRAGHGKLVQDQNGDWWCMYLCGRPNEGKFTTCGRESALDRVEWTADGWFTINGGKGPSLCSLAPDLPQEVYEERDRDDFDGDKLDLTWQFVRNPDTAHCSLTERRGFFRIWTQDATLNQISSKNTLVKREKEHHFTATTALEFSPECKGSQAGIVCYYSTTTYIRWCVCFDGGKKLRLVANRGSGEELIAEVENVESERITLKVDVSAQRREFSYSTNEGALWSIGGVVESCTFLADEGNPAERKRHTGTLTGIYANNGGSGENVCADFDYFEMRY